MRRLGDCRTVCWIMKSSISSTMRGMRGGVFEGTLRRYQDMALRVHSSLITLHFGKKCHFYGGVDHHYVFDCPGCHGGVWHAWWFGPRQCTLVRTERAAEFHWIRLERSPTGARWHGSHVWIAGYSACICRWRRGQNPNGVLRLNLITWSLHIRQDIHPEIFPILFQRSRMFSYHGKYCTKQPMPHHSSGKDHCCHWLI